MERVFDYNVGHYSIYHLHYCEVYENFGVRLVHFNLAIPLIARRFYFVMFKRKVSYISKLNPFYVDAFKTGYNKFG